jgi:hypothetical protein
MYSVASIKACEFRTTGCFDVPLNQSIELIFGLSSKQTIFGMGGLPRLIECEELVGARIAPAFEHKRRWRHPNGGNSPVVHAR